jgi:hypothetical protein
VSSLHKYIALKTKSNLICKSLAHDDLKNAGGAEFTNYSGLRKANSAPPPPKKKEEKTAFYRFRGFL